jgi:cyanophycin synthetase
MADLSSVAAAPHLAALRAYYLFRRALSGSMNPETRRMRGFRDDFYAAAWEEAAARLGASATSLGGGILEIEKGGRRLRARGNLTSVDDPVTLALVGDKLAVHRLLSRAGIPVPRHLALAPADMRDPGGILRRLRTPLVVKPLADTGGGMGVSTNVVGKGELVRAIAWARAFGQRVLVEEQVAGGCYRILLCDGQLVDAVLRRPPCVVADGATTVRGLVARENRLRLEAGSLRAQVLLREDPDMRATLRRQGLGLGSRPAAGASVQLKTAINENRAEENEAAVAALCGEIIETARRAAELTGLRLAGVDVITTDPSAPLEATAGVVLEVNASPGFHYHYRRADAGCPVALRILEHFLAPETPPADIAAADAGQRSIAYEL